MSRDALIVGINSYSFLNPLKAPALDAEAIALRLEQVGEFRKVIRLPEQIDPTNGNKPLVSSTQSVSQLQLEQALEQLFRPGSAQAPETALFYFSGHGIPDSKGFDQGYLATSDMNPSSPRAGLSLRWLQWLLSESAIKQQIIWLDCCHSGSLLINVGAANPGHSDSRDRCFIASSRDFESSWEDLNSPYSVLTKALLEGLDPTRLPGRWIDTFALVDYVNQALKGELQTPVCTNFGEAINLTKTWRVGSPEPDEASIDSGICPYKGLEFFDCNEEDPKYFFGREQLIGQLLDHVRTQSFLALVGASGNGKSSVLRAGLLHQLKLGRRIAGSDQWQILITRPDAQPMKNLAIAFVPEGGTLLDRAEAIGRAEGLLKEGAAGLQRLVQASTAPRTILVIDQFEEVFTRCDSAEERAHFFSCLMGALTETGDKLCVIIAMRADFIGKCLAQDYSCLAKSLLAHTITVLPLADNNLRSVVCKPAEQVGLAVEPSLVNEILKDIKDAPGSLPLLQYTLKELWQRRQGSQLMLSDYQILGGINGTLDKRATEIYNSFDEVQKRTVQHIFQQLTQLGQGTEDTRRRVFLENLIAEPIHPSARVRKLIDTLSAQDNRLLVTSEVVDKGNQLERRAIVDVAHEALIRHWRLLQQWIEQNRDLLRQQQQIEASTVTWQEHNQDKGYVLQGLPLIKAIQFQKGWADTFTLSNPAQAFIRKSVWQRRWNHLKTASWLIIPAALVVGVVEYNMREASIKADYARLDSESSYEEKQAVQSLAAGCFSSKGLDVGVKVQKYFAERMFGTCRSLARTPLSEADLSEADLSKADLSEADLSKANLSKADLSGANLSKADLSGADLSEANLSKADLSEANFSKADLSEANLSKANLSKAKFGFFSNLSEANLSEANLSEANLILANLSEADLSGADLSEANLSKANLSKANLSKTNLSKTNLDSTIILSTDLSTAKNLTQQQMEDNTSPLICHSPLPDSIQIDGGINRNCNMLPMNLFLSFPDDFESPEEAELFIKESRRWFNFRLMG